MEELLNRCDQLEEIEKQTVMQMEQSDQVDDNALQRLVHIASNRRSRRIQFFQSPDGTVLRYFLVLFSLNFY